MLAEDSDMRCFMVVGTGRKIKMKRGGMLGAMLLDIMEDLTDNMLGFKRGNNRIGHFPKGRGDGLLKKQRYVHVSSLRGGESEEKEWMPSGSRLGEEGSTFCILAGS
ncbi:hypothetical protein FS842_002877 [Serendipita sp. 407]|nr:hypothetical protein FS842_002877 [Serendipita sp. 407]